MFRSLSDAGSTSIELSWGGMITNFFAGDAVKVVGSVAEMATTFWRLQCWHPAVQEQVIGEL